MLHKVVFIDRDGVINRDSPDFIKNWDEFEFLPGSLEALRLLKSNGFTVIVVTNQSGVSRKLISLQELEHIHAGMQRVAASEGGFIKDIFFCPHMPEDGCDCRKPEPGLILRAQQKYEIDLATAVMIGDSARDIQCARNAGCRRAVLVRTGNGKEAERTLTQEKNRPDYVADDLPDAAKWIVKRMS